MNFNNSGDIRDILFSKIMQKHFTAQIKAENGGIIAGAQNAYNALKQLGLEIEYFVSDGTEVQPETVIARFKGNPKQIAQAEEVVMGYLMKTSGIATATRRAINLAEGKIRIVSGAWKKMPSEMKQLVREAIAVGGGAFRILDVPFVYLDKNYIRMFGSIVEALKSAEVFGDRYKVVQLRGEMKDIKEETIEAATNGAYVLMIDTGKISDVKIVNSTLEELGVRKEKLVAFAGGVKINAIPSYIGLGIDILDIGSEIVDAPLMDMKLDVISEGKEGEDGT
ncbi:beta/alpha barrel domain-containing protein [Carboxydothermus ferrireducens]|uniref:Nicotinate-nucleotide pyrophosphorylase (Carboxylating) n=1 Tax=Carboxydothermus ferrireducens DSM 11255 TaxID=1119529 RepID=A0ABX2RAX2_9THEO|nr:hypothetical protein [Carboxydothermus ferrireducens]NYE58085.1 nicotinate-nucleotide pyrophosphorylase (carboxylating) [Carboxydothermus ferrireducens DSM 11255]